MSDAEALEAERREAARRTLRGQVAVVTGAAGAIGRRRWRPPCSRVVLGDRRGEALRAVARLFAGAGARVVLGDRRGEALDALVAELGAQACGGRV